ncbi:nuclease-related domain-containing protein [Microbacterium paludicola]|uniref:nuclease-related domain-containing protein n=1 Tax=Microbacterium paludicola TaxID=300019 RepID=UPI0031D982B1
MQDARTLEPAARATEPAAAVIAECLRAQGRTKPRSLIARSLGLSPLSADSRPWYLGALGELEVARHLSSLGPEWIVLHAVPVGTRGADIDHVVVGPAGVFTINSKFHEDAKVWVGSRRILVNGQKTDHLRHSRFEAKRVRQILANLGTIPVTPVLAIVGAREITIREQPDDVAVMKSSRLVRWLLRQPSVLDPVALESLRGAITDAARWGAATPYDPSDAERFAALQREVKGAKLVRIVWGTAILASMIGFGLPSMLPMLTPYFG